jgi:hypothetical protein
VNLKSCEIPAHVTTLGNLAFAYSGLRTVKIPSSVNKIGNYCFMDCPKLKEINVDSNNSTYRSQDGILYSYFLMTLYCYPAGKDDITEYTMPSLVMSIEPYAFKGNSFITSVEISHQIDDFDNGVFEDCTHLKNIIVNTDNPYYLSIDGVLYNKGLTTLHYYPEGKEAESYDVPNSVISINGDAFRNNQHLISLGIPGSVKDIGSYAFRNCTSIQSLQLPNSITAIGSGAFEKCTSMESIQLPNAITTLSSSLFSGCTGLKNIEIPGSVESIDVSAFYGCTGLQTVQIPTSVKEIQYSAFSGCKSLYSIEIPNSVTSIGHLAFYGCASLQTVVLPSGLETVESHLLQACSNLHSVEIPASVAQVGEFAFIGCANLRDVVCYANNPAPTAEANTLFSDSTYTYGTLYVPENALDDYRNTPYAWSSFQNIQPLAMYSDITTTQLSEDTYSAATIYDLNGILQSSNMQRLTPGIYVVKQGNKCRKILVK